MTQKEHIMAYLKDTWLSGGIIKPSVMGGKTYKGQIFPSELKRRCCEMADDNLIERHYEANKRVLFCLPGISLPYHSCLNDCRKISIEEPEKNEIENRSSQAAPLQYQLFEATQLIRT